MNGYEILSKLGKGSYGDAYLAQKTNTKLKCVIKHVKVCHLTAKDLEDAKKEVKVLSSLAHDQITQFYDSFEVNGSIYIVMEYCAGGDLQSLISNHKDVYFPESRILDWFIQLGLAVRFIHQKHIIHRDIKTQNVFLTQDGHIKLGDFGIAKILDKTSDLANSCIGTPYYLSPEMCESKPYSNKSDIWSVGCVLYEMVCLKHAFDAPNIKTLILKIIRCTYEAPPCHYSKDLRNMISEIFQKDPKSRPSMTTILSKFFLVNRLPQFLSVADAESLHISLTKIRKSNQKVATKTSVIRSRIGISGPASKYCIPVSNKQMPSVYVPSDVKICKSKPKFSCHILHNEVSTNPGYKPYKDTNKSSKLIPTKPSQKKRNRKSSVNRMYHKNKNSNERSLIITSDHNRQNSVNKKPSHHISQKFNPIMKANLDSFPDVIDSKSFYSNVENPDNLLVDFNSGNIDLYLPHKGCSKKDSLHNHMNSHINLDMKDETQEKNIHNKINSLVTGEIIEAYQNAQFSRKAAYASEINLVDQRDVTKMGDPSASDIFPNLDIENINDVTFNVVLPKSHLAGKTFQINKSSFMESLMPLCHVGSFPEFKAIDHDTHIKDKLHLHPASTPLFHKNYLEITGTKMDNTATLMDLVPVYNNGKHQNLELKNSITKIFSSPELIQRLTNRISTNLNASEECSENFEPKKLENREAFRATNKDGDKTSNMVKIAFPETVTKSSKINKEHSASFLTTNDIQSQNSLNSTNLSIGSVDKKRRQKIDFFLQHSASQCVLTPGFSSSSTNMNRSGIKSKSRFSSLLKKMLHHKSSSKSKSFHFLHPEFENVSDKTDIHEGCLKDCCPVERSSIKLENNGNVYDSCLTPDKDVEIYQELFHYRPVLLLNPGKLKQFKDSEVKNFSGKTENISKGNIVCVTAVDIYVNGDLSHTIKNTNIHSLSQHPENSEKTNVTGSPLQEKKQSVQCTTIEESENNPGFQISQNYNCLMYSIKNLANLCPPKMHFSLSSFDKIQCGQTGKHTLKSRTFFSSLILSPSYLESIKRKVDFIQSISLAQSDTVKLCLSACPSKNYPYRPSTEEINAVEGVRKPNLGVSVPKGTSQHFVGESLMIEDEEQTIVPYQSSLSGGETLDVSRFRHSLETLLLCTDEAMINISSSEVFTKDIPETPDSDVYGWIEEQRLVLEQQIGLNTFIKAYRCLESAFEENYPNWEEVLRQVRTILGPLNKNLARKIVQLIVTESVYLN